MGYGLLVGQGSDILSADMSANAEHVLEGKTYVGHDTNDEIGTGSMTNKTGWNSSGLKADKYVLVPRGYHDGTGRVTAASLASQTSVDSGKAAAAAAQITAGYMAWVNGAKVIGTRPTLANETKPDSGKSPIVAGVIPTGFQGYVNGNKITGSAADYRSNTSTSNAVIGTYSSGASGYVYVKTPAGLYSANTLVRATISNLVAGNIKAGVKIAGVTGTWEGYVNTTYDLYKNGTVSSDIGSWNVSKSTDTEASTSVVTFNSTNIFIRCSDGASGRTFARLESSNYLHANTYRYVNVVFKVTAVTFPSTGTTYVTLNAGPTTSSASKTYHAGELVVGQTYTAKFTINTTAANTIADNKFYIRFNSYHGSAARTEFQCQVTRIYFSNT